MQRSVRVSPLVDLRTELPVLQLFRTAGIARVAQEIEERTEPRVIRFKTGIKEFPAVIRLSFQYYMNVLAIAVFLF